MLSQALGLTTCDNQNCQGPVWIVCMSRCRYFCIMRLLWRYLYSIARHSHFKKVYTNKRNTLGPLVLAMTERPNTFARHPTIPGENGGTHRVGCAKAAPCVGIRTEMMMCSPLIIQQWKYSWGKCWQSHRSLCKTIFVFSVLFQILQKKTHITGQKTGIKSNAAAEKQILFCIQHWGCRRSTNQWQFLEPQNASFKYTVELSDICKRTLKISTLSL